MLITGSIHNAHKNKETTNVKWIWQTKKREERLIRGETHGENWINRVRIVLHVEQKGKDLTNLTKQKNPKMYSWWALKRTPSESRDQNKK